MGDWSAVGKEFPYWMEGDGHQLTKRGGPCNSPAQSKLTERPCGSWSWKDNHFGAQGDSVPLHEIIKLVAHQGKLTVTTSLMARMLCSWRLLCAVGAIQLPKIGREGCPLEKRTNGTSGPCSQNYLATSFTLTSSAPVASDIITLVVLILEALGCDQWALRYKPLPANER